MGPARFQDGISSTGQSDEAVMYVTRRNDKDHNREGTAPQMAAELRGSGEKRRKAKGAWRIEGGKGISAG